MRIAFAVFGNVCVGEKLGTLKSPRMMKSSSGFSLTLAVAFSMKLSNVVVSISSGRYTQHR